MRQAIESWGDYDVCNAEDLLPSRFEHAKPCLVANGKLVDFSKETVIVVVVRDLLNWWASYTNWIHKTWVPNKKQIDYAFHIWASMVTLATDYLDYNIPINYDIFKKSRPFRELVCNCLNGKYNESTLNKVTPQGNGSSFDPGDKADTMDTHLRYQRIMHTTHADFYIKTLNEHPKAIETYKTHFKNHMTKDQNEFLNVFIKQT